MRRPMLQGLATIVLATVACSDDLTGPKGPKPGGRNDAPIGGIKIIPPDPNTLYDITAGSSFTCVRKANGHIICWGANNYQQVGSNVGSLAVPTLVQANGAPLIASQVDAGLEHACALDQMGLAWCWGGG